MPFGQITTHTAVPMKFTSDIGTRYFQQVDMSWSTRMRGSVARIHMIRMTPKYDLTKKVRNWSRLSSTDVVGDRRHLPAAEEQRHQDGADDVQVAPLDQEEEQVAGAGVLGDEAGDQLRLGLGQVERRAVALGEQAR